MTVIKPPVYKRPVVLISAAVAIVVFIVALTLIPYGIGYAVAQWVEDNGNDQVSVEDVDFNPFTGALVIHQLHAKRLDDTPLVINELKLEFVWHKLFSKQVVVKAVSIKGVDIVIEQDAGGLLRVGGIRRDDGSSMAESDVDVPWGFAIDALTLADVGIKYQSPELVSRLQVGKLQIDNLASFKPTHQAGLKLRAKLDDADVDITGKFKVFDATPAFKGRVDLQGIRFEKYAAYLPEAIGKLSGVGGIKLKLDVQYPANGQLTVAMDGGITLHSVDMTSEAVNFKAEALGWQGQSRYSNAVGNTVSVEITGEFDIQQANATVEEITVEQVRLNWAGTSGITLPEGAPIKVSNKGKLHSEQLQLFARQQGADIYYEKLAWDGELDFNTTADGLSVVGEVAVDALRAVSPQDNITLVAFDHLSVAGINAHAPQRLAVTKGEFNNLVLGRQETDKDDSEHSSIGRFGRLLVDGIQYAQDTGLSIQRIEQTDVTQIISKSSTGLWNVLQFADLIKETAGQTAADQETGDSVSKDEGMPVRIGSILVTGDSNLIFEDQQVEPKFRQEVKLQDVSIKSLDSASPQQDSPVVVKGIVGKSSNINISGVVSPFAKQLTLDLQGQVDGLPLYHLSSYSKQLLGYMIDSGELDAEVSFKAVNGKLEGNNKLKLHQVEVKALALEEMQKLKSKLDVPLETGLNMLRDKHNNIQLNLPITGDVDNFKVDPADVINQALGKAMKQAAKSYLSLALFPYGTLLTVVAAAGDKAMQINLDPITYAPGSTGLSEENRKYLAKVASILQERPEIHIKLCGVSTDKDRQYLVDQATRAAQEQTKAKQQNAKAGDEKLLPVTVPDEQLIALSTSRAEIIEAHLIDTHGTKPGRLVSCRARIETKDAEAKPYTELSLR